jgi:hypothetical protein
MALNGIHGVIFQKLVLFTLYSVDCSILIAASWRCHILPAILYSRDTKYRNVCCVAFLERLCTNEEIGFKFKCLIWF